MRWCAKAPTRKKRNKINFVIMFYLYAKHSSLFCLTNNMIMNTMRELDFFAGISIVGY